jgi:hypothetical protein
VGEAGGDRGELERGAASDAGVPVEHDCHLNLLIGMPPATPADGTAALLYGCQ